MSPGMAAVVLSGKKGKSSQMKTLLFPDATTVGEFSRKIWEAFPLQDKKGQFFFQPGLKIFLGILVKHI